MPLLALICLPSTQAFADGERWNTLQRSPGVYDEAAFVALDRGRWTALALSAGLQLPTGLTTPAPHRPERQWSRRPRSGAFGS